MIVVVLAWDVLALMFIADVFVRWWAWGRTPWWCGPAVALSGAVALVCSIVMAVRL